MLDCGWPVSFYEEIDSIVSGEFMSRSPVRGYGNLGGE